MRPVAHLGPALAAIDREAAVERGRQDCGEQRVGTASEADQRAEGVAVDQRAAELAHAGERGFGRAEQADGEVEQVDAGGRHRPGRRLLPGEAPVVGWEREELVLAEIGLDLQRRAQRAGGEQAAEFEDGWFEPSLVADAEDDAG